MKRNQLIQIAIIIVALICGYKFIESLIGVLITVLFQFSDGFSDSAEIIITYLIILGAYCAGFFLLIRYNKQIADYIDKPGESNTTTTSELIPLSIQQSNLLYVVLIALCLITLIAEVPVLVLSIYDYFKKEAGNYRSGSPDDLKFKTAAIKLVFTIIILFTAKSISIWFSKQFSSDKPILETLGEPDETNSSNL